MAEIEKYFRSIFGSNENFKICFRDYLTFSRLQDFSIFVSGHLFFLKCLAKLEMDVCVIFWSPDEILSKLIFVLALMKSQGCGQIQETMFCRPLTMELQSDPQSAAPP